MIETYDSFSRKYKKLGSPKKINLYVCGITTSDYCHLGHAFSSIVFEVLDRFLSHQGFDVYRVQNFTDVDDKILNKSIEEGTSMKEVAEKYTKAFFEDMDALGIKRASIYPKATEEIENIISFILELEKKELTYIRNNSVYFKTNKFNDYGKLSGRKLDDAKAGTRVNVDLEKESQEDFALWKSAKSDEPGWDSPWGLGRPGWHIECSSMVNNTIGETVDIHGGGIDLIFPHHENEIAQSESLTGKKFANIWMHNGMVKLSGEKMSKSLGNLITVKEALKKFDSDQIRMWILSSHYRSPLIYSEELIASQSRPLSRLRESLKNVENNNNKRTDYIKEKEAFINALSSDLNTPVALSQALLLSKKINSGNNEGHDTYEAREALNSMLSVLGLCQSMNDPKKDIDDKGIKELINKRESYRKNKEFDKSDQIRDELIGKGVKLIDKPDGITDWELI
ncbi:MAG: cysteine--tRNA ligase [Chloroflexota bacterium]|nr:cysteine--tRNA ligase [Chloroflexota bacterium]